MWVELISAGILLGDYIYHRITDEEPPKPKPVREITLPRTDEGAPYPLLYGRYKIESPVLLWCSTPVAHQVTDGAGNPGDMRNGFPFGSYIYSVGMFFAIATPFRNGVNRLHRMYVDERVLSEFVPPMFGATDHVLLPDLTGEGGDEPATRPCWVGTPFYVDPGVTTERNDETGRWIEGHVEFLDGNDAQVLQIGGAADTVAALIMGANGTDLNRLPGYRHRMCATLYGPNSTMPGGGGVVDAGHPGETKKWCIGTNPTIPAFAWDASSYPQGTGLAGNNKIGVEANPADVLFDLLTNPLKLALPGARVDVTTFTAAAVTLLAEGHGFSRAFEEPREARELVLEILRQIDAVIYEDPSDLKIKIKLVRGDYSPFGVPAINPDNCARLEGLASSGWANLTNKIRVVYRNRQAHYREDSATAQNPANAVGQDGQVFEVALDMPGVCTEALAKVIASRELSARSRPLTKCRAIVDRTFSSVRPGDVVRLNWDAPHITNLMMRVGGVDHGKIESNEIALDLIQDFFYAATSVGTSGGGGRIEERWPGGGGSIPPFGSPA